jgi:hypothetical protein
MGSTHFEFFRILHFLQMYFAYNFFLNILEPIKKKLESASNFAIATIKFHHYISLEIVARD